MLLKKYKIHKYLVITKKKYKIHKYLVITKKKI